MTTCECQPVTPTGVPITVTDAVVDTSFMLLRDWFCGEILAAGAVNNTPARPGPGGNRIITDIGGNFSVDVKQLSIAGGTGVWGQTALAWSTGVSRPAGYASGYGLEFDIVADTDKDLWVGFCTTTAPGSYLAATCEHGLLFASDGNLDVVAAGAIVKANAVALANGMTYRVRFILYSSGCFYSISGGAFGTLGVTYSALHETISQTTATVYAAMSNLDAVTTIDRVQTEVTLYPITFDDYVTDVPHAEAEQLRLLFRLTAGNAWTDKTNWLSTVTAANWFGITVATGRVTRIEPYTNNLVGNVTTWGYNTFTALTRFDLSENLGLLGGITSWILPATLERLYLYTTSLSGDISSWILPATMTILDIDTTPLSGDISSWILPATMSMFEVFSTAVSGNIGAWVIPAMMAYFYVYLTTISGSPVFTSAVALRSFRYQNCALPQVTVDLICQRIYNRRMSFTYATPNLQIGGTNAAPSGIYQAACPPGTGKEYIYELVNDSCGDGFKKWAITYTP